MQRDTLVILGWEHSLSKISENYKYVIDFKISPNYFYDWWIGCLSLVPEWSTCRLDLCFSHLYAFCWTYLELNEHEEHVWAWGCNGPMCMKEWNDCIMNWVCWYEMLKLKIYMTWCKLLVIWGLEIFRCMHLVENFNKSQETCWPQRPLDL